MTKGQIYLDTSVRVVLAMLVVMNNNIPTGGVMHPIANVMTIMTA